MPEPGISDRNFNRPTTKPVQGSHRGRLAGKRSRAPIKVPSEYAGFRLEDGQALIDVLGEAFFLPEGDEGLSPIDRKQTRPDEMNFGGFGTPSDRAAPDGDNEAEFTNLPFGPEEGGAEGDLSVTDQPKPGQHPRGRMAQPDYGIQREISKLQQELDKAEDELEELRGRSDDVPGYKLSEAIGKTANLSRAIGKLELEAEQIRQDAAERRKLAARNAAIFIPVTGGKVDTGRLAEGQLYKTQDGTLFVWDGEAFRQARRLDEVDEEGRGHLLRSDPADRRVSGHPGAAATPRELVDAAEAIQRETGGFGTQAGRIRVLATELAGVQDRLRNYRLNGLSVSDPRVMAARKRLADGMPKLRAMYGDLEKAAKPEAVSIQAMAGRMDDPGVPENMVNAGIQGAAGSVLNIAENFDIAALRNMYDIQRNMDKIDQGAKWTGLVGKDSAPNFVGSITQMYATSKLAMKARLRKMYAVLPISEIPAFQNVKEAREWVAREFETNPRYKDHFGADQLPRAVGGLIPPVLVALVLKSRGVPFTAVSALDAAMAEGVADFHNSLKRGDSIETAFEKHRLGMWLGGVAELLPVPKMFSKVGDKSIVKVLIDAMVKGTGDIAKGAAKQKIKKIFEESPLVVVNPDTGEYTAKLDDKMVTFSEGALEHVVTVMLGLD